MVQRIILNSIAIACTAMVGDKIGSKKLGIVAALCDNFTHFLIGCLTWTGVAIRLRLYKPWSLPVDVVLCGIFASIIDVDHFLTARSLNLKEATSIDHRPFFHCTSLAVFSILLIFSVGYFTSIYWLSKISWIILAAVVSHHIRDSTRRGFWLYPFGTTTPTPYFLYIFLQILCPIILSYINIFENTKEREIVLV